MNPRQHVLGGSVFGGCGLGFGRQGFSFCPETDALNRTYGTEPPSSAVVIRVQDVISANPKP